MISSIYYAALLDFFQDLDKKSRPSALVLCSSCVQLYVPHTTVIAASEMILLRKSLEVWQLFLLLGLPLLATAQSEIRRYVMIISGHLQLHYNVFVPLPNSWEIKVALLFRTYIPSLRYCVQSLLRYCASGQSMLALSPAFVNYQYAIKTISLSLRERMECSLDWDTMEEWHTGGGVFPCDKANSSKCSRANRMFKAHHELALDVHIHYCLDGWMLLHVHPDDVDDVIPGTVLWRTPSADNVNRKALCDTCGYAPSTVLSVGTPVLCNENREDCVAVEVETEPATLGHIYSSGMLAEMNLGNIADLTTLDVLQCEDLVTEAPEVCLR